MELTKEQECDTIVYTVNDIRNILSLGKTKVYELMRSDGFPSFRLNNRFYVTKNNFEKWLDRYTNKTFRY
jgi:hypothetical protein